MEATIIINPNIIPIIGARKIKIIVFVQPESITAQTQAFATALPRYHPKRACDELVGSPQYHVNIFQEIAHKSPQNTTVGVTILTSIIHFPIVFATAVHTINTATKLKNAAHITAYFGARTRVETIVAIEFALSCIPFVKSKAKATAIIKTIYGFSITNWKTENIRSIKWKIKI